MPAFFSPFSDCPVDVLLEVDPSVNPGRVSYSGVREDSEELYLLQTDMKHCI